MKTRSITKPAGYYQQLHNGRIDNSLGAVQRQEARLQQPRGRQSAQLGEFVARLNYAIVSILRRKRTQIEHGKVYLNENMARVLKGGFGITGKYSPFDLKQLSAVESIRINDRDVKKVVHFESRIFTKRSFDFTDEHSKHIRTHAPIFFAFKIACADFYIDNN